MKKITFVLCAAFAMYGTALNAASTWYVAANGNNSNAGTSWASPYATIQKAINVSANGDTILVTNGTYAPIFCEKNITIQSMNGPEVTIIDGGKTTRCANFYGDHNTVLVGFTLQNGYITGGSDGGGVYGGYIANCILMYNQAGSNYDGWGGGACRSIMTNCVLISNTASYGGGAADSSILENCLLTENTANHSGGGAYGGTLNNCTIVGNTASNEGGGTYEGTLKNCVIWGNTAAKSNNYALSILTYSCTTPLAAGDGNIASDPFFVNAAAGNYRLQSNSPCINAGDNAQVSTEFDLDGNARIQGERVDLGAYETSIALPDVTLTTPVLVPYSWLVQTNLVPAGSSAEVYEAAANSIPPGKNEPAWKDYVAGTDPLNSNSLFTITSISISNETPSFTWNPDLGSERRYIPEGVSSMDSTNWNANNVSNRFFRIRIEMQE